VADHGRDLPRGAAGIEEAGNHAHACRCVSGARVAGTLRIRHAAAFDVHEIATASGTVVREYVSAGGRVFGIAWHGPRLPDLRRLLGSHFERYRGMPRDRRAGRSLKRVALADLVVESSGHLRSFSGKAWLPGTMPRGVGPEDIR
jgi:hypothetical protein